jgi:hypothetical protein
MPQPFAPRSLAAALALVVAALLLALAQLRTPGEQVFADEGTYLAMVESLVEDHDLRFADADRERVQAATERGRQEVILQRDDDGKVYYSKPIVYPLLAAPAYAVAGQPGLALFNALTLLATLWLAWRYLRRLAARDGADSGLAELTLVTFVGAAVVLPYVFWRMGDLLQWCCALAGLILALERPRLEPERADRVGGREALGMALLALLVLLRISNGLVAVVPIAAALLARRWRRAAGLAVAGSAAIALLALLSWLLIGSVNPYRAIRTGFMPETGYPTALAEPALKERFDEFRRRHTTEVDSPARARQAAFSALYFLAGRHSGLLLYFPAAALFACLALRRRNDAAGWAALAAFLGTAAFFVAWKPENYFGGATFIGNRYLLSFYPALLLALPRLPGRRALLLPWLVALPIYGSALYSESRAGRLDEGTQGHAYAGLLRALPFETTAQFLDGVRDRYWSGQLVRFVDPYADVDSVNFVLHADRPAAELELAQWEIPSGLRFFVATDAAHATLEVSDYKQTQRFPVGKDDGVARTPLGAPVDVRPARAWRRHFFWFAERPYYVRSIRLKLVSADPAARATLTFFGDPFLLEQMVNTNLHAVRWPERAVAGGQGTIGLRIENKGSRTWEPEDPATVTARWRIWQETAGAPPRLIAESGRLPLPRAELMTPFDVDLPLQWPAEPGRYMVEVDLVLEHIAWFQDRLGKPLLRREIDVQAP